MQDSTLTFNPDIAELTIAQWMTKLAGVAEKHGFFQPLGRKHFAAHVRGSDQLIVTFETVQGMRALSVSDEPLGWKLVRDRGWSHLLIASDGDTWFREGHIYALFDRMVDDGFFDMFENVLFYGAGPCGYAAAAFSVAAPGARVFAIQPQATLDPRVTEWDDRFTEKRRADFTSRYGYAPVMLDACEHAYVLYDPVEHLDAMHAALFTRPGVTKLRLRNMGGAIQSDLLEMHILLPMLEQAAGGTLNAFEFAKLYRARRNHLAYLRHLLTALDAEDRSDLTLMLTRNVTSRMNAPRFQRRLSELDTVPDKADPTDQNLTDPARED